MAIGVNPTSVTVTPTIAFPRDPQVAFTAATTTAHEPDVYDELGSAFFQLARALRACAEAAAT